MSRCPLGKGAILATPEGYTRSGAGPPLGVRLPQWRRELSRRRPDAPCCSSVMRTRRRPLLQDSVPLHVSPHAHPWVRHLSCFLSPATQGCHAGRHRLGCHGGLCVATGKHKAPRGSAHCPGLLCMPAPILPGHKMDRICIRGSAHCIHPAVMPPPLLPGDKARRGHHKAEAHASLFTAQDLHFRFLGFLGVGTRVFGRTLPGARGACPAPGPPVS